MNLRQWWTGVKFRWAMKHLPTHYRGWKLSVKAIKHVWTFQHNDLEHAHLLRRFFMRLKCSYCLFVLRDQASDRDGPDPIVMTAYDGAKFWSDDYGPYDAWKEILTPPTFWRGWWVSIEGNANL